MLVDIDVHRYSDDMRTMLPISGHQNWLHAYHLDHQSLQEQASGQRCCDLD